MHTAPSLAELQNDFMHHVLNGDRAIETCVKSNGLPAIQRMQIYRHIVENTLAEALQTSYPAILLLVGEAFFAIAADRYMRRYPPKTGNLQDYGAQFSALLSEMKEATDIAYLPDIARLEWARQLSFLAADVEPMAPSDIACRLQGAGDQPIQMILHPSVKLLISTHPVFDIWHYCMQASEDSLHLDENAQSVLLWRDHARIAMQLMDAPAIVFLAAVLDGMDMQHAFAEVRAQGHVDFDLSELLPFLVANQLIIHIHTIGITT